MPAKSQAQRRWAYWADAHPEESGVRHRVAKEFQAGPRGLPSWVRKSQGGAVAEETSMKKTPKGTKKADMTGAPNGQGTVSDKSMPAKTDFPGKVVMEESKKPSAGFKRGGAVQHADGNCPPGRMDKKRRGGRVTMRGRSPISGAGNLSAASTKTTH